MYIGYWTLNKYYYYYKITGLPQLWMYGNGNMPIGLLWVGLFQLLLVALQDAAQKQMLGASVVCLSSNMF